MASLITYRQLAEEIVAQIELGYSLEAALRRIDITYHFYRKYIDQDPALSQLIQCAVFDNRQERREARAADKQEGLEARVLAGWNKLLEALEDGDTTAHALMLAGISQNDYYAFLRSSFDHATEARIARRNGRERMRNGGQLPPTRPMTFFS